MRIFLKPGFRFVSFFYLLFIHFYYNLVTGYPNGFSCSDKAECESNHCSIDEKICIGPNSLTDGSSCYDEGDCQSNYCVSGICGNGSQN